MAARAAPALASAPPPPPSRPVLCTTTLQPSPSHTSPCSSSPQPSRHAYAVRLVLVLFWSDVSNIHEVPDHQVVEHSGTIELAVAIREALQQGTAIGKSAVSKGRQGREAQNIVRLYLANIRLKNAATDVVITAYEPLLIK
ncbi:hypothetical protein ZWY2020_058770 [Hordeum vulgare]|nr:hypothetical protein ZWY2020_058770 [Hordeum vulgare]